MQSALKSTYFETSGRSMDVQRSYPHHRFYTPFLVFSVFLVASSGEKPGFLKGKMFVRSFFFLFFFLAGSIFGSENVRGSELGLAPPVLDFNLSVGEMMCENVSVISEEVRWFEVSDAWALKETKNLSNYVLRKEELQLMVAYPELVRVSEVMQVPVCVQGERAGKYAGVLLFRSLQENLGLGAWIDVEVQGERNVQQNVWTFSEQPVRFPAFWGVFEVAFLIVLLLVLWRVRRRQRLKIY